MKTTASRRRGEFVPYCTLQSPSLPDRPAIGVEQALQEPQADVEELYR